MLLILLLLVCGVGRGAYAYHLAETKPEVTTEGDTRSYTRPAQELLLNGAFDSGTTPTQPEFLRTPGYPVFVASVWNFFGETNLAVLLAQVALSLLTISFVYLLASRMWSTRVGLLAACCTAIEPLQNYASATLATESLGALSLMVLAYAAYSAFTTERPRAVQFAILGLLTAVATLIRPVTYFFPLVILVLLASKVLRDRARWRGCLRCAAVFLLPLILLVGGWQVRNQFAVDSYRVSGIDAKNTLSFRAAGVHAEERGIPFEVAQQELRTAFGPMRETESQGSYYRRQYETGVDVFKAHPVAAIKVTAIGLWDELFSVRLKFFTYLGIGEATGLLALIALVFLLLIYACCLYGIAQVIRKRQHIIAHASVFGIACYILLMSAGPEAMNGRGERFRAPIMPILILYAAFGAVALVDRQRQRSSSPLAT
ncbi:MAG: glycosyltransferase family 39 protein [Acidimicrobiia bacterium]